ncbi:MAG: Tn3 family transposase [Chloroflexi bacterium OHK40]|uniref:Tn3 family transposase n=1 Tax=Chloroflexus sp. TaxID=1904827 RepID=UPI002ACDAD97|nr:Tn3 family transposase [Chloroflexus sp.]
MASIDRTAYPVYRRTPSLVELEHHYTVTAEEREWLRANTRRPAGLLCCAVLFKAVQHLGYFPVLSLVPASVIAHLRLALALPETVSIFGVSGRSVKTYIQRIREHQGLISHGRTVRHLALTAMLQAAETSDAPVDLINVAIELLYKQRAEFPAFSTLDRLARRVRTLSQARLAALLRSRLTEPDVARLLALLKPVPDRPFTPWNDLKPKPEPATYEHFDELLDHLTWVEQVGRFAPVLDGVAPRKVQQLAAEARVLDAAEVRALAEPRQLLLVICLVHQAQAQTRDAVVTMFIKRVAAFQRAARKKLEELQRTHQNAVDQLLATFQTVLEVHATIPAEERDAQIVAVLDGAGGPTALHDRCAEMRAFTGNNHLPLVWKEYRSHRSLCFRLIEALILVSTSQDTSLLTALEVIREHQHQKPAYLPATLDLSFAPEAWQRLVVTRVGGERVLDRKQLEACVFVCLANELRTGDVAVDGTNIYPDTRAQLLPWAECAPLVAAWAAEMGLPPTASAFVADMRERLATAATLVDQQFPEQDQLSISPEGVPVLKRLPRRDIPRSAYLLERRLLGRMPDRHLLDMVAAVGSWTNCTRHLGPPAGTEPKLDDANADYTRLLFAYGTNLGPAQAARHMREAVSARSLSYLNQRHVTSAKLNAAQADIINVYHTLTLPRLWGVGRSAAADGTLIPLADSNPLAELHFRYRMYGGIAYHHVADNYIAIFSHFIPCGVWEAIYIIDGLLKNQSELQPRRVHADTQGQSTPVFALAHLLGIELLPRIRNWKDLIFYKADADTTYSHIEPLFGGVIDWVLIERHWQDLIQVVLSIRAGTITAEAILRRLGHESRKNRLYQVFRELGRVIRTLFLLRYISDPPMRGEITAETNKVEAYNGFSKWLSFGNGGVLRDRDPEESEKSVKYTDVLANVVILHNVYDMTAVLRDLIAEGFEVRPQDIATLSPYLTNHIKRFGEYTLSEQAPPDFAHIAGWELPAAAAPGAEEIG